MRRQRRGGAATGLAGGRVSCWMSPIAWNFSSTRVPYTMIGDPGVSDDDAAPRRADKSTGTNCPSSACTTTEWSVTAYTVPRSSDQRGVPTGRADTLADGFD